MVATELADDARELGRQARRNMDPLCEEHLRKLEYHPTHDEFSNTQIYKEFMELVYKLAEREGYSRDEVGPMLKDEFIWELREAFDEAYLSPSTTKVECVQCLSDGDIDIRVNNPEELTATELLDGKVQSGNADDSDDMNAYR